MHIPVSMHALHIIALERTRMAFFLHGRTVGWSDEDGRSGRTDGWSDERRMVTVDGRMGGRMDGWPDGRSRGQT